MFDEDKSEKKKQKEESMYPLPKTLPQVISVLQRLKLKEKDSPLDKDFVVFDQKLSLYQSSMRTAVQDCLLWLLCYVGIDSVIYFIEMVYYPGAETHVLWWTLKGSSVFWTVRVAGFASIVSHTFMCMYMCRYNIGVACKTVVSAVLWNRAFFLVVGWLLVFVAMNIIRAQVFTDGQIAYAASMIAHVNTVYAERVLYFMHGYFKGILYEAPIVLILAIGVSNMMIIIANIVYRAMEDRHKTIRPTSQR
ncbi:MAG: hypothetical protein ACLQF0_05405 [Dissulfurispiraceae bacterium]